MTDRARALRLVAAFAAVYVLWGSTYLGIRIAVESLPPLIMAGTRHFSAGLLLLAWTRWQGAPAPSRGDWPGALLVGALLLLGGNGGVSWAELRVPSGLAALIIANVPLWMVLLDWLRPGGTRPRPLTLVGLALGAVGLIVLVGPGQLLGGGHVDPLGAVVLIAAALSWATGSLVSRSMRAVSAPMVLVAIQMIAGGALLILTGLATGELARLDLAAISLRSALAWGYLVVFGSMIGYTAYAWLLKATTPAKAATYAYVNPIVAMLLGWGLGGEAMTPRMIVAGAVIVASVALITVAGGRPSTARAAAGEASIDREVLPMRRATGSPGR
jgi:drug/metabolite transporter (DMT)-like permease